MPRLFSALLICTVVFTLSTGYAPAQETPDLKPYIQKKVNFPAFTNNFQIVDWHITGKKTSAIYFYEYDIKTETSRLFGYKLSPKGVAGQPFTIMTASNGFIYHACAVRFDSAGSPVKSAAGAAGLLLVAYLPDITSYKMVISAIEIDAEGKPLGTFRKIMEKNPPVDERVGSAYITGSAGAKTISIIIGFSSYRATSTFSGTVSSQAYYLQTDLNGLQLGGISEVPLPGDGNLNICIFGPPYWTGSGWMMPVNNTKMKVYADTTYSITRTKGIGNEFYVYRFNGGAGAPAVKFKRRLLYKDNEQKEFGTFRNVTFLDLSGEDQPQPGAKKTNKTLTMFFGHRNAIPDDQWTLDRYDVDYYLVPIDLRGKLAGDSIKVDISPWQHGMPYDPNKSIYGYTNGVSNLVQGDGGRLFLAQNRSTLMGNYVSASDHYIFDCEHELNFYELDPATGGIELIAQKAGGTPVGFYYLPILRWFNNKPAILDPIVVEEPAVQGQCYFTNISIR